MTSGDGWVEWRAHVLKELERLSASNARIYGELQDLRGDVQGNNAQLQVLKYRAGLWGALAAMLPVIAGALFLVLKG